MSNTTKIQWCDSTVNPVMGCKGCELFPKAATILLKINEAVKAVCNDWPENGARELYTKLIGEAYEAIQEPSEHHKCELTTTNLYHLRERFQEAVQEEHSKEAAKAARKAIEQAVTCYAAKLHMNKANSLLNPDRKLNKGYAPTFEVVTPFDGRVKESAGLSDLLGCRSKEEPWMGTLARTIFVSDMGDAFSREEDFDFLEKDTMSAITGESGQKHLWLWLTKQPHTMAKFAERIGGFPENVCAMTTMTSANDANQKRLRDLKAVKASIKGLSIEPLWEEIKPEELDLEGIDWVIVGGESGAKAFARPFHLEWARSLRDHCKAKGVAFFMKQTGSKPMLAGKPVSKKDTHGGDWTEWDKDLQVREFPAAFHDFRKAELEGMDLETSPDRSKGHPKKAKTALSPKLDASEKEDLQKLETTITSGVTVFMQVGHALAEIKNRKLYREEYKSFQEYCEKKHGFTRQYGYLLADAARTQDTINPLLVERGLQGIETERSLRALKSVKDEQQGEVIDIIAEEVEDKSKPIPFEAIKKAVDSIKLKSKAEKKDDGEEDEDGGVSGTPKPETKDPAPGGSALTPWPGDAESTSASSGETEGVVVEQATDAVTPEKRPGPFQNGFKDLGKNKEPGSAPGATRLVAQLEEALEFARSGKTAEAYAKLEEILAAKKVAA